MKEQQIIITFENGETLKGELVSWSKELTKYTEEVVQYNFSIRV